jgi:hypothetical protein
VQQIDDDSLRSQLMAVVTTVLSERDSANAAQIALSTIAPGKMQNDAVIGSCNAGLRHDPASAAAWVTAFPEGELRTAAVEKRREALAIANRGCSLAEQPRAGSQPGQWLARVRRADCPGTSA